MKNHENENERKMAVYRDDDFGLGLFHPFLDDFFSDRPFRKEMRNLQNLMRTDIVEQENGYEFRIEVPGYEKSDLNIGLENGYLTVSANQAAKRNEQDQHGNFLRRERITGACSRSFYVGDIDEKAISAELQHGVLTVVVPKESRQIKKHIEIK